MTGEVRTVGRRDEAGEGKSLLQHSRARNGARHTEGKFWRFGDARKSHRCIWANGRPRATHQALVRPLPRPGRVGLAACPRERLDCIAQLPHWQRRVPSSLIKRTPLAHTMSPLISYSCLRKLTHTHRRGRPLPRHSPCPRPRVHSPFLPP